VPGTSAIVVGYLVAAIDEAGQTKVRAITNMQELESLFIDEAYIIADEELEIQQRLFETTVRKQFETAVAVPKVEEINVDAGRSQQALNYLIIRAQVRFKNDMSDQGTTFGQLIAELEQIFRDREQIRTRLSIDKARQLHHLLFDTEIPQTGDIGWIDAPQVLLMSSLESAHRLANSMKRKKSEFYPEAFLARIDQEIDKLLH